MKSHFAHSFSLAVIVKKNNRTDKTIFEKKKKKTFNFTAVKVSARKRSVRRTKLHLQSEQLLTIVKHCRSTFTLTIVTRICLSFFRLFIIPKITVHAFFNRDTISAQIGTTIFIGFVILM